MAQNSQVNPSHPNTGTQPVPDPSAVSEPVPAGAARARDERTVTGQERRGSPRGRVTEEVEMVRRGPERASPSELVGRSDTNSNDSIAAIREDIARTRAKTARTIDAIQYRLSPESLKAQAREKAKEVTVDKAKAMARSATDLAKDTGGYMFDTIKDNIVPTVLITSGLAWLIKSNSESHAYGGRAPSGYPPHIYPDYDEWGDAPDDQFRAVNRGYYSDPDEEEGEWKRKARGGAEGIKRRAQEAGEGISGAAAHARERSAEMAADVRERMGRASHGVRRRTAAMGEQGRYRYRQARRGFFDTLHENPLALAGAAVAVGVLFGSAIPETESEREWMGDTRDDLMREARDKGRETAEKARHVAEHAAESAKEAAEEEAKRQDLA